MVLSDGFWMRVLLVIEITKSRVFSFLCSLEPVFNLRLITGV